MSVIVQLVIGELYLVEGNDLLHPVRALRGRVGVDVDARWRDGICFSCDDPARAARNKLYYCLEFETRRECPEKLRPRREDFAEGRGHDLLRRTVSGPASSPPYLWKAYL